MAAPTVATAGEVTTGFSKPYVALYTYSATDKKVTYSSGMRLARGVDVSISPSTPDNSFYADNALAETANYFTNGTFSVTVDGLIPAAEALIMGITAPSTDWGYYDDSQKTPYVAFGFIQRRLSSGVETYRAILLLRVTFDLINESAATQEQDIAFQTQSLSGKIYRSEDTATETTVKHAWKAITIDYATEDEAESAIKTKLGITA